MFKLDLEKANEKMIKLPRSTGSLKKDKTSRKTSTSALFTTLKPLTVWVTTNCGKFLKSWEYHNTLPAYWETCMEVKKKQFLGTVGTMEWFKNGKGCILSPCLFNLYAEYIMRKSWTGRSTSWNQDCREKYQ